MKRLILTLILICAFSLALAICANASYGVFDEIGVLSYSEEMEIEEALHKASNKTGLSFYVGLIEENSLFYSSFVSRNYLDTSNTVLLLIDDLDRYTDGFCYTLHLFGDAVDRISVGETVRHDEIEHTLRSESHSTWLVVSRAELEFMRSGLLALFEEEIHSTRLSLLAYIKINEKIVRVFYLADFLYCHTFIILKRERSFRDILSIEHHLQFGVLHSGIPEWRINSLYVNCMRGHTTKRKSDADNELLHIVSLY